mmetsp:Transcript_30864/g.67601  ORF Transcript_30864/g.67601 Transcript_30864/m.67601 type:complete len:345 (-) Transcript_30864:494-1528(-)
MPLTEEELVDIQAECLADDIDIDLATMTLWDREDAVYYFENGGQPPPGKVPGNTDRTAAANKKWTPPPAAPPLTPVSAEDFKRWFPKLKRLESPKFRIVCFHNAGSAESNYSGRGLRMKVENPFVVHCAERGGELLACELPGREQRRKEKRFVDLAPAAEAIYQVLAPVLQDGVPYVLVGHSMGTWCLFELLKLLMTRGVPMPSQLVVSCFPAPSIPEAERPWRKNRGMPDEAFKDECRGWDVNEIVFVPQNWEAYAPMMRDDFTLFDEYQFSPAPAPFPVPIQAYFAKKDRKISQKHVEGWKVFTAEQFSISEVAGNHLFFYDFPVRNQWMETVISKFPAAFK